MVGIVIVTHGDLAEELLRVTELIVGKLPNFVAVSIDPTQDPEVSRKEILARIKKVNQGEGVLLLTDMFGGTPSNLCLSFLDEGKIEVLTGVNLPILIKLATYRGKETLTELAKYIQNYGQKNICLASNILKPKDANSH